MPRRPSSTLFPYTTLFRSHLSAEAGEEEEWADEHRGGERDQCFSVAYARCKQNQEHQRVLDSVCTDRKSTRLNSSHANISYAVFCLKKKNARHRSQLMYSI